MVQSNGLNFPVNEMRKKRRMSDRQSRNAAHGERGIVSAEQNADEKVNQADDFEVLLMAKVLSVAVR